MQNKTWAELEQEIHDAIIQHLSGESKVETTPTTSQIFLHIPENIRNQLKTPLGDLIKDVNKENILSKISSESIVITVGDKTTENMIDLGIRPQIQVIDGLEKRNRRNIPIDDTIKTELTCKNPPGQITEESMQTIQKAFSCERPVRIIVKGEEDLLVIPACMFAPENSVVMYGQPNEGLVIVRVTPEIRSKVQKIVSVMNQGMMIRWLYDL